MKLYTVIHDRKIVQTETPGLYAGWGPGKIFGTLSCKSGMRMQKENRVFFATLEDAVTMAYLPCTKCKPINEELFSKVASLYPPGLQLETLYSRRKTVESRLRPFLRAWFHPQQNQTDLVCYGDQLVIDGFLDEKALQFPKKKY